jgi:hypothetical protein
MGDFWGESLFEEIARKPDLHRRNYRENYSSLHSDIRIFDEHIFIFEYLDMFNIF